MLIVIDMQNEYVHEKGKAHVNGAKDLEKGIIEKIREYQDKGESIFYTINTKVSHEDRDKLDKDWAVRPYGKLKEALGKHSRIEKIYYGITAEQALMIKSNINNENDTKIIEFVGVETNICVLANMIIFQNLYPNAKIVINSKLCSSSNISLHNKALDIMNELNMEVI